MVRIKVNSKEKEKYVAFSSLENYTWFMFKNGEFVRYKLTNKLYLTFLPGDNEPHITYSAIHRGDIEVKEVQLHNLDIEVNNFL